MKSYEKLRLANKARSNDKKESRPRFFRTLGANINGPAIHGWVYGLSDGLLNPLITLTPDTAIDPVFQYDFPLQTAS